MMVDYFDTERDRGRDHFLWTRPHTGRPNILNILAGSKTRTKEWTSPFHSGPVH